MKQSEEFSLFIITAQKRERDRDWYLLLVCECLFHEHQANGLFHGILLGPRHHVLLLRGEARQRLAQQVHYIILLGTCSCQHNAHIV